VPITNVNVSTSVSTTGSDVQGATASVDRPANRLQPPRRASPPPRPTPSKSHLDVERYTPLVQKDSSPSSSSMPPSLPMRQSGIGIELEATVIGNQAAVTQALQKLSQSRFSALQSIRTGPDQVRAQQAKANAAMADVKQAQARVDQALLNLSYTHITAPTTGIVNKRTCR